MKFKLNLNKTKLYALMQLFDDEIPSFKKCVFFHFHSSMYWMDYYNKDSQLIRVCVTSILGIPSIRFTNEETDTVLHSHDLDKSYLFNNQMLRSVQK